jgi:glycine/D-amino acid oxidase-like deaminating enzyme
MKHSCGWMQVFEPADLLYLIGKDPFNDYQVGANYYISTGDSGQGMTSTAIAGQLIPDLIMGRHNPYADVRFSNSCHDTLRAFL